MRLDGGEPATTTGGGGGGGIVDSAHIDGLTEDEMLQLALAASLEPSSLEARMPPTQAAAVALTDEPPAGKAGSCLIQFRMPNGSRSVRRFWDNDPVGMIYAFVENESNDESGQGKRLGLRCGFPPTDLQTVRDKTIREANLAGESIQCRYV